MAVEVTKKPGENNRALLRRFSRRVQQSGVLLRARKNKFHERSPSEKQKKERALKRMETREKMDKLRKMGLLEEDNRRGRR